MFINDNYIFYECLCNLSFYLAFWSTNLYASSLIRTQRTCMQEVLGIVLNELVCTSSFISILLPFWNTIYTCSFVGFSVRSLAAYLSVFRLCLVFITESNQSHSQTNTKYWLPTYLSLVSSLITSILVDSASNILW